MGIRQKVTYDAGVASPKELFEINDLNPVTGAKTGPLSQVPHSIYKIVETTNLVFTYNMGILGGLRDNKNLNIADGERRPGSLR
ncbi:MAG: hypothetical protein PHF86_06780 [Candidatus Nanoarchaeia archaeon]|nr:hypothetical protein [Candidatus Nanoarchaeia archaeon]